MTRSKHLGNKKASKGSDRILSPQRPFTGDGRTNREIHDKPDVVTFRTETGKVVGKA